MMKPSRLQTRKPPVARILGLATAMLFAACSDAMAPGADDVVGVDAAKDFHQHLRWETPPTPGLFTAQAGVPGDEVEITADPVPAVASDHGSASATVYQVSFWAVRGQLRGLGIYFQLAPNYIVPFLSLRITDPMLRPDGSPVALGDSALITVAVDLQTLRVDLQPSGIQFGDSDATELTMWYGVAGTDFNYDGLTNHVDKYIEDNLLSVWMQEDDSYPWSSMQSEHSVTGKWFKTILEHFSGYAVSW